MGLPPDLQDYLVRHGVRETELLKRLRDETALLPQHNMQIAPEQGALLALLVELIGARRCLEIGTFTGYSSLVVATGDAVGRDDRLLRRLRGVDGDRAALLGRGRRRRPRRPAARAGPRRRSTS